ncbi:MAG: protein kinase, partial [Pirellulaceae bacterium]
MPTPELRQSDTWQHFARRLRLLLQLRHPGSRRLLDMELARSSPFVVLEHVSDECLVESDLHVGTSWHEVMNWAQEWCGALAEAHRLGIQHGAIHRGNFLSRGPRSWILDFSTLEERSGDRSRRSAHLPEREGDVFAARFETDAPDDVAQLAAALRELLAGPSRPPLQACPELQQLLEECQHIDPDERPTALELSSRLRKIAPADFDVAPVDRTLELARTPCSVTWVSGQPRIPERLGRFELLDKLGEGGMGTVYRARDTADGSLAAIKVLRSESLGSAESHRRFAKEARMLAQARNPYVANLLEFNEDGGVRYLAVEFVPGGTIARLLGHRGRLPVPVALALAGDAARGLAIAHRRGIV